jgi:hypothetical protein
MKKCHITDRARVLAKLDGAIKGGPEVTGQIVGVRYLFGHVLQHWRDIKGNITDVGALLILRNLDTVTEQAG